MESTVEDSYNSGTDRLATHLVGIRLCVKYPNLPKVHTDLASSFVLEVRGKWFLITAGHFLRQIDDAVAANGQVKVQLADGLSSKGKFRMLLPYPYSRNECCVIDKDGLDFAVLPISPLMQETMKANGTKSLGLDCIRNAAPPDAEFSLHGLPTELIVDLSDESRDSFLLSSTLLRLDRLPTCPPSITDEPGLSFYGRLRDGMQIKSIKGMSGGPIFAVGINDLGKKVYWLVAVQSCWDSKTKEIAGCLVRPIAEAVETYIEGQA